MIVTENTSVFLGIAVLNPPGPKTSNYTIDDGMDPSQSGSGVSVSKQLIGSRATVKSGATITVTCSPSITISTANGAANDYVSMDYSVDLVYTTLGFSGTVTDPNDGGGMAAPVGQGINSAVSTRSVFGAVGTVTSAQWSVSNGDACASFNVSANAESGHREPFHSQNPYSPTSDHWYYFKGTGIDGQRKAKAISVAANLTVPGVTTTATMANQIFLYGPIVNQSVAGETLGPISAYGLVTEDCGGIDLTNGGDWGSSPPGFTFDFDSVQLCNVSRIAGSIVNINTNGELWLDNDYPYGEHPYSDQPKFGHSPEFGGIQVNDFFLWSGVCAPSGVGDAIWVNCGSMNWSWQQDNAPLWGHPTGALSPGSIIWGLQYPLEWDHRFRNVNDPNGGGGPSDPGGPTSPGGPGSSRPAGPAMVR